MKKFCLALSIFLSIQILFDIGLYANQFTIDNIPIQEGGRIKPLDTYARNQALAFYGKRKIKHEDLSAINWLADLFIFPEKGLKQKVFNIRSPEVVDALGPDYTNNFHRYSYNDIYPGVENQLPLISSIFDKKEDDRDSKCFGFFLLN